MARMGKYHKKDPQLTFSYWFQAVGLPGKVLGGQQFILCNLPIDGPRSFSLGSDKPNFEGGPPVSLLAPLGGFLWFPPGEPMSFFWSWVDYGNASCGKLKKDGKLLNCDTLQARYKGSQMNFWR